MSADPDPYEQGKRWQRLRTRGVWLKGKGRLLDLTTLGRRHSRPEVSGQTRQDVGKCEQE
jgi:hypothetical protein